MNQNIKNFLESLKNDLKEKKEIRLGDLVAKTTKAVGINPCSACKKRQESLNRFKFSL